MKDRLNKPTPEEFNFFTKIDKLTKDEKIAFIQNIIIPQMDIRRGKPEHMSNSEIHEKLNRPAGTGKAGENIELLWEKSKDLNAKGIDAEFAAEIADITYYGLQPNANENDKFENLLENEVLNYFNGIPVDSILAFCIIKYSTRLEFGDRENYKEIEFKKLSTYLALHPELTDLWIQPTYQPAEDIYTHIFE